MASVVLLACESLFVSHEEEARIFTEGFPKSLFCAYAPYSEGDTIRFLSAEGDSLLLVVEQCVFDYYYCGSRDEKCGRERAEWNVDFLSDSGVRYKLQISKWMLTNLEFSIHSEGKGWCAESISWRNDNCDKLMDTKKEFECDLNNFLVVIQENQSITINSCDYESGDYFQIEHGEGLRRIAVGGVVYDHVE